MRRDRKHSLFAWILITIGVIFVLENFGIVDGAFSKLWPVLLIVIGAVMIIGDRGK
ncbi:MAG: DUF5668 domain-containing protein [archaeon]|nr:DUF5668 domain-containing protein [archaeon]